MAGIVIPTKYDIYILIDQTFQGNTSRWGGTVAVGM